MSTERPGRVFPVSFRVLGEPLPLPVVGRTVRADEVAEEERSRSRRRHSTAVRRPAEQMQRAEGAETKSFRHGVGQNCNGGAREEKVSAIRPRPACDFFHERDGANVFPLCSYGGCGRFGGGGNREIRRPDGELAPI